MNAGKNDLPKQSQFALNESHIWKCRYGTHENIWEWVT